MVFDKDFTLPTLAHRVRQRLRRGYRRLSPFAPQTRAAFTMFARTARLLLPASFRSRKELLVLPSAVYSPGLFSAFATVLGLLDHYDNWQGRYAGIRVDFGTEGLYYDPSAGDNWWEYFFEPIEHETGLNSPATAAGTGWNVCRRFRTQYAVRSRRHGSS